MLWPSLMVTPGQCPVREPTGQAPVAAADVGSLRSAARAELYVVDELDLRAIDAVAARRALRIAAQLQLAELGLERVVDQEPALESLAQVQDELDRLGGLEHAHDAGQHAEHTGLLARRRLLGRRRLRVEAAVARAAVGREHRELTLEAEDRRVDDRLAELERGVVDQVAGLEVVGAVDDDVEVLDDLEDVVRGQARLELLDLEVGVQA